MGKACSGDALLDQWTNGSRIMATITGTTDADTLFGTIDKDVLSGLEGNDTLAGNGEGDVLDGGTGSDTASYTASTQAVIVNLLFNTAAGGDAKGDSYVSIENISGSAFDDSVIADGADNVLSGNAGNDSLRGLAGNDTLRGGQGADLLEGDNGRDTVDYSGSSAGVSASLTDKAGHSGDAVGDTFDTIENLTGSINNDTLEGDGGINVLIGGQGNDDLFGREGDDSLFGGEGIDVLMGQGGFDRLEGGIEGDVLVGGLDGDTLTGGQGADLFIYQSTSDGTDFITDFEHGIDRIDLHTMDASDFKLGNQEFDFITGPFTTSGQISVVHDVHMVNGKPSGTTIVLMNTDLSLDIDYQINVKGLVNITESDFIL
jgi:Ca2+-binding RTX toxin-like protein